jgi:hypothetical protein
VKVWHKQLQVLSMAETQPDRTSGMASATTAQFLRSITLSIAMAAFLLASYLSCNLWLRTATGLPATARSPGAN